MSIKELKQRLGHLVGRPRFDRNLAEEMATHLELRADELVEEGLSREEALRRARVEFGSMARLEDECRDAWRFSWLEELLRDLRFAARSMKKSPGFAAAAIVSLALGAGVNTTVFSLTAELLLGEPSVRDGERLVSARLGGRSHARFNEYQMVKDSGLFDGVAGIREEAQTNWRQGEETRRLRIAKVTPSFFAVTGTPLAQGRGFGEGERHGVVVHHAFWKEKLGADPQILGRSLVLDGEVFTVIGVLPEDHRSIVGFGYAPALYLPVEGEEEVVKLILRLPPGVSRSDALARVEAVAHRVDQVYVPADGIPRARFAAIEELAGRGRLFTKKMMPILAFFTMLLVVVGLVLLVACANVAGLHLARAAARRQELSVRVALGAGRSRVVRQLLTESLLLAAAGTVAGLALSFLVGQLLSQIELPLPVPIRLGIHPDPRLLVYALVLAGGAALVSGIMPALAASRLDVQSGLRSDGRGTVAGGSRGRNLVVGIQLVTTVILLSAGILFWRNLTQAGLLHPGFDAHQTVWATVRLVPGAARAANYRTEADTRLRALPGVVDVATAEVVPLNDSQTMQVPFQADGRGPAQTLRAQLNRVTGDYFRTMGIALLRGRTFTARESAQGQEPAILNESMAKALFGSEDPVGHEVYWTHAGGVGSIRVIGVARDSKYVSLGEANVPAIYRPVDERAATDTYQFLLRTAGPPAGLLRAVRFGLQELDATAAVEAKTMADGLAMAFLPSRVGAIVLGVSGGLGLLLAATGLYSVLAYAVSRRTREIGLRVALGAPPMRVLGMVLRQSTRLVLISGGVGFAVSLVIIRPLRQFLVEGVGTLELGQMAAVWGVLLVVAGLATLGPACKALKISPLEALRED